MFRCRSLLNRCIAVGDEFVGKTALIFCNLAHRYPPILRKAEDGYPAFTFSDPMTVEVMYEMAFSSRASNSEV
jgi:hypothetical protein